MYILGLRQPELALQYCDAPVFLETHPNEPCILFCFWPHHPTTQQPPILVILQAARQSLKIQPIGAGHRTLALRSLCAVFRHRWMLVIGEQERVGGREEDGVNVCVVSGWQRDTSTPICIVVTLLQRCDG